MDEDQAKSEELSDEDFLASINKDRLKITPEDLMAMSNYCRQVVKGTLTVFNGLQDQFLQAMRGFAQMSEILEMESKAMEKRNSTAENVFDNHDPSID